MTVESFASEYHEMKERCPNGKGRRTLPFARVGPLPKLLTPEEKPGVVYWSKEVFLNTPKGQPKGETDGNATTIEQKNKPGRPPKSTDDDDIPADKHKHRYLEREDGTPIRVIDLRLLGQKARENWMTLISYGYAPKTWGQISGVAWEFYARAMLNETGLEFLRLCDDGQWKLREWTTLNYSGWAGRHGVREGRAKTEPRDGNTLDDKNLIHIEGNSEDEALEYIDVDKASDEGIEKSDLGPVGKGDTTDMGAGPGDIPNAPVYQRLRLLSLRIPLTHYLGCKHTAKVCCG